MTRVGHAMADMAGRLSAVDVGFCDILRMPPARLIGINTLDLTAIEDRDANARLLTKLLADGKPFTLTKRYMRDDGSHVWVKNHVSLLRVTHGDAQFVAYSTDLGPTHPPVRLDDYLHTARLWYEGRRIRTAIFGTEMFLDPA